MYVQHGFDILAAVVGEVEVEGGEMRDGGRGGNGAAGAAVPHVREVEVPALDALWVNRLDRKR